MVISPNIVTYNATFADVVFSKYSMIASIANKCMTSDT